MSPRRRTAAAVAIATGLAVAPSAIAIGPADFAVNIPDGPTQMGPPTTFDPTKNCTPALPTTSSTTPPSGVYSCTGTYQWSSSATPMSGTVTVLSTGAQGTIALRCDWNLTQTIVVAVDFTKGVTSPTTNVTNFSGTGGQACSWEIKVGSSTLIGTLTGTALLSQPNPSTGRFTGTLSIVVVGGTGEYKDAVGTGTMVQQQDFPFPTPTAPPVSLPGAGAGGLPSGVTLPPGITLPPGVSYPGERAREHAVQTQAGSRMNMRIKAGKPTGRFLVPKGKVTAATQWKAHIAATPSSRCTMTAVKGSKTVALGTKRAGRTGSIVGSGFTPAKLVRAGGTGTWSLRASCTKGSAKFSAPNARLVISRV